MTPADPGDALTDVARRLNAAGIRYMLTGSGAGMFYGLNRATADLDIVIDLDESDVPRLVRAFEHGHLVDAAMASDAVSRSSMFNVISLSGGLKVDFIVLGSDPFDREAMARRVEHDWHGTAVDVIEASDLILNKLKWAKASESERQLEDVRAILAAGSVTIDERFGRWAACMGLAEQLDACLQAGHDS